MTPNSIYLALTDTAAASRGLHLRAGRVALIYALAGATWILLSDRTVEFLFDEVTAWQVAQRVKGTLFVLISATLMYWLAVLHLRVAVPGCCALNPPTPGACLLCALTTSPLG